MAGIVVDEGGPTDKASIPLATKKGRWIKNVRRQERAPDSMLAAERVSRSKVPSIITRSLSATYNCFGMVFASRRTWVEADQLGLILDDDGYRRVRDLINLRMGDIVMYKTDPRGEVTHSGIIVNIELRPAEARLEVTVLSQWGADGEYFHREEEVPPEYGQHREYFTERRTLP